MVNLTVLVNQEYQAKNKQTLEPLRVNPDHDFRFDMNAKNSASKAIAPKNIWTNGKFSVLDFRGIKNKQELEKIVIRTVENSIDTPVNTVVRDGVIIVHDLFHAMNLTLNGNYVCIYYTGDRYNTL